VMTTLSRAHTTSVTVRRNPAMGYFTEISVEQPARPVRLPSGQSGGQKGLQP